ncbi:hypothetical protein BDR26DRAFT_855780 [Obelidium mucronatum]|nr:hypothetical protein BDR26DRAFT_855780 [Obelidium mucronatum]
METNQTQKSFKVVPKGKGTDGDGGVAGLRKRIRDAERLLRRPKLPATAKQDLERRIKALNRELLLKTREVNENEVGAKYKFVKHLERKKVLKKISRIEKQLKDADFDENEKSQLEDDLSQQRINLAYIEFYPKDMKYISLFPTSATAEEAPAPETVAPKNKKKRKVDSVGASGALSSEELKTLIQSSVRKAVESGEAKKENFTLRMRDVLDDSQMEVYLAQTKLIKKVKTPIVAVVANDGARNTDNDGSAPEKKSKKQPKKAVAIVEGDDEVEDEENEDEGDDFFLTGDAGDTDGAPVEQIDPEDFFVERAVKQKKGPKDAAFRAAPKKGKIRK